MSDNIKHEDFGEKIGGAKKDLWKKRGLYSMDLSYMNEREKEKFVKKDNIWKKLNYDDMIASGVPVGVAYYIKKVRDSISASPMYYLMDNTSEKRIERQKEYIDTVRQLQSAMENVSTVNDVLNAYERFLTENGYAQKITNDKSRAQYVFTDKGKKNKVITKKLISTLYVYDAFDFEKRFTRAAVKNQFCVPQEEKIPAKFNIHYNDGKYTYSKNNDNKPGTWYVTKGHFIVKDNFETREEALKWAQEFAKQQRKKGKTRFVPNQLKNIQRNGPDYRDGKNVDGNDYLDTFCFRGGEFGNWLNENDRQASLNMGYEALKDLAYSLNISDKDIAYQGELAIAFGSRGSGNAMAHYEPMRKVINLTKMHGAGSLAHEWWHGFDDYLGKRMGAKEFLSDECSLYPLFSKLIRTMKYKSETPKQAEERTEQLKEKIRKNALSWLDYSMDYTVKHYGDENNVKEYDVLRKEFISGISGSVEKLNNLKKSMSGHVISKKEREKLMYFENVLCDMQVNGASKIQRTKTDYYKNSVIMDKIYKKDGGYWSSDVEMTARAFACYVKDKLPYRSDYLVGHAESAFAMITNDKGKAEVIKAYPQGEERKAINAVFDEIIADLKLRHILTHEDKTLLLNQEKDIEGSEEQLSFFNIESASVIDNINAAKAVIKNRSDDNDNIDVKNKKEYSKENR